MAYETECERFRDAFLTGRFKVDDPDLIDVDKRNEMQRKFKNEGNAAHPMQANSPGIVNKFLNECANIAADTNFFNPPLIQPNQKNGFKEALKQGITEFAHDKSHDSVHCAGQPSNISEESTLEEAIDITINSTVGLCNW